ncbi:MAG TPA: TIGR02266 family protein [Polyangia bacterium]|nr:TIGR02266 family protein [Polyangia bacterium]
MSNSAPVRVRLRYADLETFIERFSANVTRGGVFIASRAPRPVGDLFAFEVQLATGQVALAGEGKVIWVKEFDPTTPTKAHGMGVQFTALAPASREILQRMLQVKGTQRGPNAPRGLTQPLPTVGSGRVNGAARARVDTGVDLAAEFGLDDATLRRAVERAWGPGGRPNEDELQGLLKNEAAEPATLAQALKDLPRMLAAGRRRTGAFRTLEGIVPLEKAPSVDSAPVSVENGVVSHAHDE